VDIILLDLQLPDSWGIQTFEMLYQEFPTLPFIVLTGLSDENLGIRAVQKGAQDFLNKNDLNSSLLMRAIRYAIGRKKMMRRLEQAQQLAKVGNWELQIDRNLFSCSPQIYTLFEKPLGANFNSFVDYLQAVHQEDQASVALALKAAIEQGQPFKVDHRILMEDGRLKYVVMQGQVERNEAGRPTLILGTSQDITDRVRVDELIREKELALRAANLRQEFLAKTSHEIRTPLNPILLLTSLLLDSDLSPEQKEHLNTIRAAGETLLAVVNDILDLSKIEAGKIDFSRNPFSIRQVFEYIKDMLDLNARENGIGLILEVAEDIPPYVVGDNVRLTQILLNLVGNAIKFTNEGHVKVKALVKARDDKQIELSFSVEDTGMGIPQNKLKDIFESFQQIDSEANRRLGGTGLGLTIVRQLVRLQGGNIEVQSEEGKGSTFTFHLAFGYSAAEKRQPEHIEIDKKRLLGLEVLLVEDNPLNQLVTKKLLSDWSIEVEIANNGKEGVDKLKEKDYDLVLMDVQMPEMDGYEATRYIRQQMAEPKAKTPIIALTANAFSGSDDECLKAGMDDYVSKPIEISNLYAKIVQHARVRKKPEPVTAGNASPATAEVVLPREENRQEEAEMERGNYTDLTYLEEISGGDNVIIRKTIDKFLETTPGILQQMQDCSQNQDYDSLAKCAHKLKSSVAFMGIEEARKAILKIEHNAKNSENLPELPGLVHRVNQIINDSFVELRDTLSTL
ncbi:MAG: response regulator, partial [Bacteroidota bacterium]